MRDTPVLRATPSGFHGLALEAHIVELYANAVATFLASIRKPYFLDPVFYKFARSLFDELAEKRWVDVLAERYEIEDLMEANPEGFDSPDLDGLQALDRAVARVLDYQRTRVPALAQRTTSLASLIGETPPGVDPPEFLIPPYIIATDRLSIKMNLRLAREAMKKRRVGEKLYAVIAITRDFLSSPVDLQTIITDFSGLATDGYLLWIADFKDWEEDSAVLKTFAGFVRELSTQAKGREVINLFGGYFSTVLAARGLLGASVQGVGIAEFRDPFVTGGGFAKRYYVPISRQFVSVDLADDLRDADPTIFSCSCTQCRTGVRPGTMSVQALAQHFVETRSQEFQRATGMAALNVADELSRDKAKLMRVKIPGVAGLASAHARRLDVWGETLRELIRANLIA